MRPHRFIRSHSLGAASSIARLGRFGGVPLAATIPLLLLPLTAACSNGESKTASNSPTPAALLDESFDVAKVVRVVDGVTIAVEVDGRVLTVRYLGLELPVEQQGSDGPTLEERALEFNRFLVQGRQIDVEEGPVRMDAEGRLLLYVYVDGEMVNKTLLTNGYAAQAKFPAEFEHRRSFALAEEGAKREQRGYWEPPPASRPESGNLSPSPTPAFGGGTLPSLPGQSGPKIICDYSGTVDPVIKGNVEAVTGDLVYYAPDSLFYSTTEVNEDDGDRFFCTETDAVSAGFKKSKH